jgi:hypothetical protein
VTVPRPANEDNAAIATPNFIVEGAGLNGPVDYRRGRAIPPGQALPDRQRIAELAATCRIKVTSKTREEQRATTFSSRQQDRTSDGRRRFVEQILPTACPTR